MAAEASLDAFLTRLDDPNQGTPPADGHRVLADNKI
jgi:hypothetical protein